MRGSQKGVVALALIVLSGCAVSDSVSTTTRAIKGGYADYDTSAVVGLVSFGNQGFGTCSGTLISPNVVLTARHCISPTLNQIQGGVSCDVTSFGNPYAPQSLYVTTQQQLTQNPNDYTTVWEVALPPTGSDFCGNDVALLVLASPINIPGVVPMIPRVDSDLTTGDTYSAVGYGAVNGQGQGSGMRRRRDGLTVTCVGFGCAFMAVKETEWTGDKGVCSGDSGGPAVDGQNRVVGVASRGAAGCNYPVYASVSSWGEWIKDTTVYAAQKAGIKPPDWATGWPTDPRYSYPVGNGCGADDQCLSGVCNDGYCTRQCLDEAPCPAGFTCEAGSGFCVLADVGGACEADSDCPGGTCAEGLCTRPCNQTGVLSCPDGYRCDTTSWVCELMPVGGACTANDECETRQCVDGLCTRPCNDKAPCESGMVCSDGACVLPAMGDGCVEDTDCASGTCLDGACTRMCWDDMHCTEGWLCNETEAICEPIPVGDMCVIDADCDAGRCFDGICTRTCDAVLDCPEGFECSQDSGLCEKPATGLLGGCAVRPNDAQAPWLVIVCLVGLLLRRRFEVRPTT